MPYEEVSRVLYNSVAAGLGVPITSNGNSGVTAPTLIDTKYVEDLVLSVTCGAPSGTNPTLMVQVDALDACGNWITQVVKLASNITAAGTYVTYGGLHVAGSNGIVLTAQARVAWTIGGTANPSFPGAQISLIGR